MDDFVVDDDYESGQDSPPTRKKGKSKARRGAQRKAAAAPLDGRAGQEEGQAGGEEWSDWGQSQEGEPQGRAMA